MSLKGKVAIVTGGNSGIGQAIVLELARLHANVVIDYVCHPEATEALEQLRRTPGLGADPAMTRDRREELHRIACHAGAASR
jgi:NAD(P)-dependent dehydrogenase (short-subunit alcohol dehydrogenase family)